MGAGQVDPALQAFCIGHEAEGHFGGQALDGGAGGDRVQAETADHQRHAGLAVRTIGSGVGLGRSAAVGRDDRQDAVGSGLRQARDRGRRQRRGGTETRCADGDAAGRALIAAQGHGAGRNGKAGGGINPAGGQILIQTQAVDGEGLHARRDGGRRGGGGPFQRHGALRRSGAGVA